MSSSPPQTLTRQALHELIWETPMVRLAPIYGITPQELSQVCKTHDIVTPGSRYWTLKSMGRPVEKLELVTSSRNADELITIAPRSPRAVKPPVIKAAAKPKPKIDVESLPAGVAAPPSDERPAPSTTADGALHPAAAKLRAKLEADTGESDGLVTIRGKGLFPVVASPNSAERIGLFLSELIRSVEGRGWQVKPNDKSLIFVIEDEPLACELIEQTDRVPHVKNAKEIAALQRFEDDKARALKRREWFSDWNRPKLPDWDHVPNGKLTLKFEASYHHGGLRRSFADGKRQRLEGLVDAILESFAAYAAGEKAWREEQERRRLQAIEDEKLRREAQRRQTLEAKRLEFLTLQLERHEEAKRVEDFVAAFGAAAHPDASVSAFLNWATNYAQRVRSAITPEALSRKLQQTGLMDDAAEFPSWRSVE